MNTIDTSAALGAATTRSASGGKNELGQEDYLTLMVAQIQNQDPFAPMENGQFVAELAQFSTVSGIESLNQNFNSLAASISSDQTLQASGLIGRDVLIDSPTGYLGQDGRVGGAVDLPVSNARVSVEVRDAATGALVRRLNLGQQDAGLARFEWDGRNDLGEVMPAGAYTFNALADAGNGNEAVPTLVRARVASVSLAASGGLTLNFPGIDALPLSQVREIS